jgi:F-type H+-transporting ATPase subunit b
MLRPLSGPLVLAAAEGGGSSIMNVDTTLWVATLVAFAVFAGILAKFAWGPLLKIVDEREKAIRDQVESAERAAADAKAALAQHQELLRGAARERDELLARAAKDAEAVRAELQAKARADAEQIVARAREQMQREREQAVAELRSQVADIAVEAASRIVKSSLSEDAQRKLVDDYIRELPRGAPPGRAGAR